MKRAFAENFGDKQEISIAAFTQGGQSLKEAIDGLKRILDRAFTNEYRTLRKGTKVLQYRDGAYGTRRINIQINPNTNDIRGNQVDCVFLLRKTYSAARFTRQIGFALRLQSRYKPLIIDFVDNINSDTLVGYNKVHTGYSDKHLQISSNIVKVNLIDYRVSLKDFLEKERKLLSVQKAQPIVEKASEDVPTHKEEIEKAATKRPEENKALGGISNSGADKKESAEFYLVNQITDLSHPWVFNRSGQLKTGSTFISKKDRQSINDAITLTRKRTSHIYEGLDLSTGSELKGRGGIKTSIDDAVKMLFGVHDTGNVIQNRRRYESIIYSEVDAFGEGAADRILVIPRLDAEIAKMTPTSIFEDSMSDIKNIYIPDYREYCEGYRIDRIKKAEQPEIRAIKKFRIDYRDRTEILAELASLLIALKAQLTINLFRYRYRATAIILANPMLDYPYIDFISANRTEALVDYRIQELENRVDSIAHKLGKTKKENILDYKFLEYKMLPMIDRLNTKEYAKRFQSEYAELVGLKRSLRRILEHITNLRETMIKAMVIQ